MNHLTLPGRVCSKEELFSLEGYSPESFNEALLKREIELNKEGLILVTQSSRFGPLPPASADYLSFIFRTYPRSFLGGFSVYNSLGLTTQVPNIITIYSNHQVPYTFPLINITPYSPVINPKLREVYPLIEYLRSPNIWFTDHPQPEQLIKERLLQVTKDKEIELRALLEFHPLEIQARIKTILSLN